MWDINPLFGRRKLIVDIHTPEPDDHELIVDFYTANEYFQPIDPTDVVIFAKVDNQICGAVRIIQEEGVTILRGMLVAEPWQGKGIGKLILERANKVLGSKECYSLPYRYLRDFYGSVGFEEVAPSVAPEFLSLRYAKYREQMGLDVIVMGKSQANVSAG